MYYVNEAEGFGGCGHRHRTIEAAERCLDRAIRRYRALPGGRAFCPWRPVAKTARDDVMPRCEWVGHDNE